LLRSSIGARREDHRRVDLSDELSGALQDLRRHELEAWFGRKEEDKERLAAAGLWNDAYKLPKVVFCNENGSYLDVVNVTDRHFARCLKTAGLKRRRFHGLRHRFASLLLTDGAPIAYERAARARQHRADRQAVRSPDPGCEPPVHQCSSGSDSS
jgi:integrase